MHIRWLMFKVQAAEIRSAAFQQTQLDRATTSETVGGQSDNRDYSTEGIYCDSGQESDSWDYEDTMSGDSRGLKMKRSEMMITYHQQGFSYLAIWVYFSQTRGGDCWNVGKTNQGGFSEFYFAPVEFDEVCFYDELTRQ